jgi:hypothetical protein
LSSRKMKTSAIMIRASAISDAACANRRCEWRKMLKINHIFVAYFGRFFVSLTTRFFGGLPTIRRFDICSTMQYFVAASVNFILFHT